MYAKYENVETELEIQYINNCFCERLNIFLLAYGWQEEYQDRCPDYLNNINYYYFALPVYGLATSFTNIALTAVVEFGTAWLKFTNITSEAKFKLTLVWFLLWINMTTPLLLVYFNF